MTTDDPFGRAVRDHYLGERDEPLLDRDGATTRDHPVEEFYFEAVTGDSGLQRWRDSWLDGPLLDMGAGVGSEALYWQDRFETVAIEISDHLVETMEDRGVENAMKADMFALREQFERDRFASAHAKGTQLALAGSMHGLREFLGDLAAVTQPDATAVVDCHDPGYEEAAGLLGYREDPTPGLAHRVLHFEYEGAVGETLLFRLFGPERLREATVGTGWEVAEVRRPHDEHPHYYVAALTAT